MLEMLDVRMLERKHTEGVEYKSAWWKCLFLLGSLTSLINQSFMESRCILNTELRFHFRTN